MDRQISERAGYIVSLTGYITYCIAVEWGAKTWLLALFPPSSPSKDLQVGRMCHFIYFALQEDRIKTVWRYVSPAYREVCVHLLTSSNSSLYMKSIWLGHSRHVDLNVLLNMHISSVHVRFQSGQSKIYGTIDPHCFPASSREPATGCMPNALKFKEVMKKLSREDKNTSVLPQ